MPKLGYTVDGVPQYAPEYYDDNGLFLGPLATGDAPPMARHEPRPTGPSFGQRLLAALGEGIQGFADASSVPNVAAGGGTDVMRGLSYALNKQQERRTERQKMALQHEMNQANQERARATAAWYSARPELEREKVESKAAVDRDKSAQGWRKIDISGKNSDTSANYKSGMLGVAQQNANTNAGYKGTMADVAKTNAVTGANRLAVPFGMRTTATYDDLKNGARLIPEEYADRSPVVNANIESKEAGTKLTDAKTDETKARTSLMPQLMQIRATMAHAAMLGAQSSAERAQIAKNEYGFNYKGEDENGQPVLLDEQGNRVIPKALEVSQKGEKIPAQMQTKVAGAHTIVWSATEAKKQIDQLVAEGRIGPLVGLYEKGKAELGFADDELKALLSNLENLASLQPAVHGFRGVKAAEYLKKATGSINQKPEALKAALDEVAKMSQEIIKDNQKVYHVPGARRMPSPKQGQTPTAGAVTMVSPDGKSTMQVKPEQVEWYQKRGAKVVNAQ